MDDVAETHPATDRPARPPDVVLTRDAHLRSRSRALRRDQMVFDVVDVWYPS